ncbi:uncharacterized protein CPUR_06884 [Claviceps purpurea 20.1]|uniref:Tse2 ADP-ribosyltransferase toxin domain-containing protein n=1 Tax=Claviceps purpurea (strain 20.1) TaxID=1111077 RepID=M1VXG1_CLAP2|nr:uncharacterized protein CPUR_06884 [Claviceps purpurea 20.1]
MIGRFPSFSHSIRLPHSFLRRQFSVKAIYSSFPATLHYCSPSRTSALFNIEEKDSRPEDSVAEGVTIDKDGLVYPAIKAKTNSNGAPFYPNTFLLQEIVRQNFDYYLDCEEEGKKVQPPFIFTISKGTPIPSDLILINNWLSNLNRTLDEFYNKHALKEAADDWLDKHDYKDAVVDDDYKVWMAK